ncbi:hypothetical protein FRB90_001475 [Tulasnella sp. 427]|nr:hypothetical protein FRB90_001475 [Tulasnella sp. 427]
MSEHPPPPTRTPTHLSLSHLTNTAVKKNSSHVVRQTITQYALWYVAHIVSDALKSELICLVWYSETGLLLKGASAKQLGKLINRKITQDSSNAASIVSDMEENGVLDRLVPIISYISDESVLHLLALAPIQQLVARQHAAQSYILPSGVANALIQNISSPVTRAIIPLLPFQQLLATIKQSTQDPLTALELIGLLDLGEQMEESIFLELDKAQPGTDNQPPTPAVFSTSPPSPSLAAAPAAAERAGLEAGEPAEPARSVPTRSTPETHSVEIRPSSPEIPLASKGAVRGRSREPAESEAEHTSVGHRPTAEPSPADPSAPSTKRRHVRLAPGGYRVELESDSELGSEFAEDNIPLAVPQHPSPPTGSPVPDASPEPPSNPYGTTGIPTPQEHYEKYRHTFNQDFWQAITVCKPTRQKKYSEDSDPENWYQKLAELGLEAVDGLPYLPPLLPSHLKEQRMDCKWSQYDWYSDKCQWGDNYDTINAWEKTEFLKLLRLLRQLTGDPNAARNKGDIYQANAELLDYTYRRFAHLTPPETLKDKALSTYQEVIRNGINTFKSRILKALSQTPTEPKVKQIHVTRALNFITGELRKSAAPNILANEGVTKVNIAKEVEERMAEFARSRDLEPSNPAVRAQRLGFWSAAASRYFKSQTQEVQAETYRAVQDPKMNAYVSANT